MFIFCVHIGNFIRIIFCTHSGRFRKLAPSLTEAFSSSLLICRFLNTRILKRVVHEVL